MTKVKKKKKREIGNSERLGWVGDSRQNIETETETETKYDFLECRGLNQEPSVEGIGGGSTCMNIFLETWLLTRGLL